MKKTIMSFTAEITEKELLKAMSEEAGNIELLHDIYAEIITDTVTECNFLKKVIDNMSDEKRNLLLTQF